MESSPSFCFITPSHAGDLERCRLLCRSIRAWVTGSITHYLVVDRRDYDCFRSLRNATTEIIVSESVLPPWMGKIPLLRNGWFNGPKKPLRNWVVQQILKLNSAQFAQAETLIFVDSDVAFIRPFDPQRELMQGHLLRLFRVDNSPATAREPMRSWHDTANGLLGLEAPERPNYVGNLITWKRSNLRQLHSWIEAQHGCSLTEAVCRHHHLSEYVLYGRFVDGILANHGGHFRDDTPLCHEYWGTTPLTPVQLEAFCNQLLPSHRAVMISAKARMRPHQYGPLLQRSAPAAAGLRAQ